LSDSRQKDLHDGKLKNNFSSSSNFDFKEKTQTESNEETKGDKNTTENKQGAQDNDETRNTEAKTASNGTKAKSKSKYFLLSPLGIFFIAVVGIAIIVLLNKKEKDTSNNDYNSQSKTSDYQSNQTIQTPTYQSPEVNTDGNQNSIYDNDIKQAYPTKDNYFTIGSRKDEVLHVQGDPTSISKYEGMNEELWTHDFSTITFKSGKVSEYSNISKNLKVQISSSNSIQVKGDYFTIGSRKDEVLQVQGDPTSISKYEGMNQEVWSYDFSSITFKSGRVKEYSNISKNLKVQINSSNSMQGKGDYFTIGSTKDEVLQVQGAPTSISKYEGMNEEVWSYDFSSITFKSGQVSEYSNISKNLKVRL